MTTATYEIDQDDYAVITLPAGSSFTYSADGPNDVNLVISGTYQGLLLEQANYTGFGDQLPTYGYVFQAVPFKHPVSGNGQGTIYYRPRNGSITITVTSND